jgi:hypothetical protein
MTRVVGNDQEPAGCTLSAAGSATAITGIDWMRCAPRVDTPSMPAVADGEVRCAA